jgi:hypothetical protein
MNLLDKSGLEFFRKDMMDETNQQIRLFETQSHGKYQELGRIRLYEERSKITRHFESCDKNIGVFLSHHPTQALLGRIETGEHSLSLAWKELDSIRHSLEADNHPNLIWEKKTIPPKVRLTASGEILKTQ